MPYLRFLKAAWPYLLTALLIGGGVWKYQQARLDVCRSDEVRCMDANAVTHTTVTQLEKERTRAHEACRKIVRQKERTIRELKRVDNLGSALGGKHEKSGGVDSDPVLAELNSLFP